MSRDLEREHMEIDEAVDSFISSLAASSPDMAALTAALEGLRRHIYFEEEMLFPPLRQAGLVPPLIVMCREHAEMWATMLALSAMLVPEDDPARLRDLAERLMAQLQEHNTKEEMIVYPAAEQMIAAPIREELAARLPRVEMPPEWVCEAAR